MLAVFLDIKRAYNITWKHGIPMILYYIGLRIHPKLKVNATKGLFCVFFMPYFGVQTAQHFCGFTEHLFIINLTMVVELKRLHFPVIWILDSKHNEAFRICTRAFRGFQVFTRGVPACWKWSTTSLHREYMNMIYTRLQRILDSLISRMISYPIEDSQCHGMRIGIMWNISICLPKVLARTPQFPLWTDLVELDFVRIGKRERSKAETRTYFFDTLLRTKYQRQKIQMVLNLKILWLCSSD